MDQQTQGQSQAPDTSTQSATNAPASLDDVYKQFNVEDTASSFQPNRQQSNQGNQQQPAQQQVAPQIPDPILDPAGHKAWLSINVADAQTLKQSLSKVEGTLSQIQAHATRQQEEADIRAAVQSVKQAGFEADDDFIEIALGQQARKDSKFLAVFNNRQKNPAAWGAALTAFANTAKGKYAFKADANLAENVRAAKQSTQTTQPAGQGGSTNSIEKNLEGKVGAEWQRAWDSMVSGGR